MIRDIGRVAACSVLYAEETSARAVRNFTAGVGRQYIGEIGKTDNGNVVVTTHLYDGKKSLPLDIELYQHATSLASGKKAHRPLGGFLRVRTEQADPEFKKKPTLALELIDKSLKRGYRPGIVLIDSSYGNNTSFLKELEAFRTAMSYRFVQWLNHNRDVFIAYKASLGFVWS